MTQQKRLVENTGMESKLNKKNYKHQYEALILFSQRN